MRRCLIFVMTLLLGSVLALPVAASQAGQKPAQKEEPKAKAANQDRIDGTVHMIDAKTKMITVRLRGKTNQQQVMYDDSTQITFRNKAAKLDDVKEGRRVIIMGKKDDKNVLVAHRIDVRDEK